MESYYIVICIRLKNLDLQKDTSILYYRTIKNYYPFLFDRFLSVVHVKNATFKPQN